VPGRDTSLLDADQRTVRLVDGIVLFWVVFWIVMGAAVGVSMWRLSRVGSTAVQSGQALDSVGSALQSLKQVPLVGNGPGDFGTQVRSTAAEIQASGTQTKATMRTLAVLLGFSVAVVPATPVAGLYVPLRLGRRRDRRQVAAALRAGQSRTVDEYLAQRAVARQPYGMLREVSRDPWADLREGRTRALADVELARLGLARPPSGVRLDGA
jgi:hypothetical protein